MTLAGMGMGKRIESKRNERDWTQTELAEKVAGLSQQTLDRLEKRDSNKTEFAVELANVLGVSLRWLLSGEGRSDELDWPFRLVARERWDACDDEERGYVQAAINKALDECEARRKATAPAGPITAADFRAGHERAMTKREQPIDPKKRPSQSHARS